MFISNLGAGYANDNLYGAYFVYEGKTYRVSRIEEDFVDAVPAISGSSVRLDASVVSGWRTFKYPRLGWRRIAEGVVGAVARAARSYSRGLNDENMIFRASRATMNSTYDCDWDDWAAENSGLIAEAALCPVYDDKRVFTKLLAGEENSFVPSHNILIEKSYSRDGQFDVYLSSIVIGRITADRKILAPDKNLPTITNIVRTYAA